MHNASEPGQIILGVLDLPQDVTASRTNLRVSGGRVRVRICPRSAGEQLETAAKTLDQLVLD